MNRLVLVDGRGPLPRKSEAALPGGDEGTFATLDAMAGIIAESIDDPSIGALADKVRATAAASGIDVATSVYNLLRDRQEFVRDPNGQEMLEHPAPHAKQILNGGKFRGDCDDVAILGASLLRAAGVAEPMLFVASDRGKDAPYRHVFYGMKEDGKPVPFDPQTKTPPRTFSPRIKRLAGYPL
ncbi:MAG: hypothetical protein ACREJD_05805 [Phycisphaerales bacterium]